MTIVGKKRYQQVLGGALVIRGKEILLVKRNKQEAIFSEQWEIPAGKKELGETLKSAVVRECKEETGLDIEVIRLFNYFEYGRDSHDIIRDCTQLNFVCKLIDEQQPVQLGSEHQEFRWVSRGQYGFVTNQHIIDTLDNVYQAADPSDV